MGGEIRTLVIGLTTKSDVDHDGVVDQVESVIEDALTKWYEHEGGKDLLACEPIVS